MSRAGGDRHEASIPQAERLYATYVNERAKAEEEAGD